MAEEADTGADAPPPVPTVAITIGVANANLLGPDEDAIAALSTFARVSVVGNSAQSLWWPMTPPDVPEGEPTGSCLSKPCVGPVPQWSYAQACKPLPLADDALTDLANSQLRVEVVEGAAASPTEGNVVGFATVALEDLLFGTVRALAGVVVRVAWCGEELARVWRGRMSPRCRCRACHAALPGSSEGPTAPCAV